MALTKANSIVAGKNNNPSPLYTAAPWQLVATNLAIDNATIVTPDTQIGVTGDRTILAGGGLSGSYLIPCLRSAVGDANGSAVIIEAYGRMHGSDIWMRLPTVDASTSVTLTTAAGDVADATYKYTMPAAAKHFLRLGCAEVVFGVKSAYTGASVAAANLYVKEA